MIYKKFVNVVSCELMDHKDIFQTIMEILNVYLMKIEKFNLMIA